ncbi:MAG: T9SS type A sorting domain-containing protein, partial [candidate division WOR-3 bacterium]
IPKIPKISLKLNRTANVEICVYNAIGSRVWNLRKSYSPGEYNLVLPALPSGVYFVYSRIDEQEEVQKIVIMK